MKIYIPEGIDDCIIFSGKIKDYDQFVLLKGDLSQMLANYNKQEPLCFFLDKCLPLESYFIGYLLKLKDNDGWNIKIHTNEYEIQRYFEQIALGDKFEVMVRL